MEIQPPKFSAHMTLSIKGEPNVVYTYLKEVPQEIMDEFMKVLGNGQAKVTVSADYSFKDFGTGASSMCAVTLSCNQDEGTIQRAAQLAGWAARKFAQENQGIAEQELRQILASRPPMVQR
jgi:hypothetical protein